MFHRQTGLLPMAIFCFGLFVTLYGFAIMLYGVMTIIGFIGEGRLVASLPSVFARLLFSLCFAFIPYAGFIIMNLFPAIRVDETGITVKGFFTVKHFDWEEANAVTNARRFKNTKAIILAPRGNPLLNFVRYYSYFMHGMIAGIPLEPVILLSGSLPGRNEILNEIGRHLRQRIAAKP